MPSCSPRMVTGTMRRSVPSLFEVARLVSSLPPAGTLNLTERASLLFQSTFNSYSPGFLSIRCGAPKPQPASDVSQARTLLKVQCTRAHFAFCGATFSSTEIVVLLSTSDSQLGLPTCSPSYMIRPTSAPL